MFLVLLVIVYNMLTRPQEVSLGKVAEFSILLTYEYLMSCLNYIQLSAQYESNIRFLISYYNNTIITRSFLLFVCQKLLCKTLTTVF